ncbi:AGE family epimerase/isomerase [Vibrio sp.]|uniref:AGE family epimerase/isomerase n=1 Tax=Vibrio sp. TaxID=678 RepID=UPI003D14701E
MTTELQQLAQRCQTWLQSAALPRWRRSYDPERRLFAEGISAEQQPYCDDFVRFRVQSRQIYVFAHATELDLVREPKLIVDGLAGLEAFKHASGGYQFALGGNDGYLSEQVNTYEQAFALMAFSWGYAITSDVYYLEQMEYLYNWLETHLADPLGGGYFTALNQQDTRDQNPHMHLFEALLCCYQHTGHTRWLDRADHLYVLFRCKFLQSGHLTEFYDRDWSPNSQLSIRVDPGHHYEWIWLLNRYQRLCGIDVSKPISQLYQFASLFGHNRNGLVRDEILSNGNELRSTSRLWCQTEYLKAAIVLWERDPCRECRQVICQAVSMIFDYYLDPAPAPGLWIDQVDEMGKPVERNSPASSFYHLFLAFAELIRIANKGAL